jgi:hypothetical protein
VKEKKKEKKKKAPNATCHCVRILSHLQNV